MWDAKTYKKNDLPFQKSVVFEDWLKEEPLFLKTTMAKIFISLLVVLSLFASFGHAFPSLKMFNTEVRLDGHLLSNATCEERKSYYINNRVKADWFTAHLMCESFGFQEVSFNNQLEMNGFLDFIQTRYSEC